MVTITLDKSKLNGRIAVLMGGHSAERDVSLQSGQAVLAVFEQHNADVIAIDPAHRDLLDAIREENIAHVFIALHGRGGEDGILQGCLEKMGVSYTGSGVLASALALDKMRCKQLWQGMELPTADFQVLDADSDWSAVVERLGETVIVKPVNEGSSLGMSKSVGAEQLRESYVSASQYDEVVIAERWLAGEEFTVAILDDKALPVIKLETDRGFYDYEAKYVSDSTRYICPCGLEEDIERQMQDVALKAYHSLGCEGWARVDLMTDADGNLFLLEVNTVPGMTSHSLVPMAAKVQGYSFSDLVMSIFNLSVAK